MKKILQPITKVEAKPIDTKESKPTNSTGNVFIKTLNVFLVPAKSRYHRFYHPKKNLWWFWHLLADLILVLAVIFMFVTNLFLLTHPASDTIRSYFDKNIFSFNQQPHLTVELTSDKNNIKIGEPITYSISYKNEGSSEASDTIIIITINSELSGGDKKIILDSLKYPELKSIAPGKSGNIKYQTSLNKKIEQLDNPNNYIATTQIEATYKNSEGQKLSVNSNKLIQKISTDFSVSALIKYQLNEGDQLGIGPLPPIAGQKTKYWIFLAVESNFNDISNFNISASLPENVRPTGKISATSPQPPTINSETNQISWSIDKIYAPSDNYPQIGAAIEIELTPDNSQIGKTAKLLTNLAATGKDQFTGEVINLKLADLDTKIKEDKGLGIISK